jgi:RNase adaptor protein for sRNA GlmZ degradation
MKIITFGFIRDTPPTDADIIINCQALPDNDTSKPLAQEKLAEARRHIAPDAVIAFGCSFGEDRSRAMARRLAEEAEAKGIPVMIEHRMPDPSDWR